MTDTVINTFVETTNPDSDAFDMTGNGDTLLVTSAGGLVAEGYGSGIYASANEQTITLDGLVYASGNSAVHITGQYTTLIVNGQAQGTTGIEMDSYSAQDDSVYVGALGQVTGTSDGILLTDSGAEITNDGHIYGAAYGISATISAGDSITNDGVISSPGFNGLTDSAAIRIANSTSETIANAGTISGPVAIYVEIGATASIENTGTILGSTTVVDSSQVAIDNSGTWHGLLDLDSSGNNTLTNSGRIHGGILFGSGDNTFADTGTLTGNVSFGTGSDTLTNTGTIAGNITFAGSGDQFTNGGVIHGNVTLGNNNVLTNSGIIHGNVTFGLDDTFTSDSGAVTGTITAASLDYFDFSGAIGHATIADFTTIARGRDIIHFGNDDFANYAALQADMAQVGKDVVIRLDPGDTIVLDNMTLAHLSTHDFTFGS